MQLVKGETYLITCDNWFMAPDGESYKGVWGTFKGIHNDSETLGIKTNRGSTNWYAELGNMFIAGCQIHYAIKSTGFDANGAIREIVHEGKLAIEEAPSRIYNSDQIV